MYTKRMNLSPDGGEGESAAPAIDFAANESAAIEYLKGKGFLVDTTEGIQAKFVSPAVQKTHSDWEAAVQEGLGEAKPSGDKGLSWVKKVLPEKVKPKEQQVDPPKPETTQVTTSVSDDVSKAEIKALQDKISQFEKDKSNEAKALEEKTINTNLRVGLKGVKFNAETEADELNRRAKVEKLIKAEYNVKLGEDGDPVFYGEDGPIIDSDTGKAITLDKLVKRDYGFMISAEKKAPIGGTGTGKETVITRTVDGVEAIIASSITDLRAKLTAKALLVGSPEYTAKFLASCKASNLDPDGI